MLLTQKQAQKTAEVLTDDREIKRGLEFEKLLKKIIKVRIDWNEQVIKWAHSIEA